MEKLRLRTVLGNHPDVQEVREAGPTPWSASGTAQRQGWIADLAGGGTRFTRLRAIMSAEGNEVVRKIIAQTFDDTSHAFIDAIHESLPHIPRTDLVWRGHFLLGALYYTLVTPERVSRLSRGSADGTDAGHAIEQLVRATVAAMQAAPLDQGAPVPRKALGVNPGRALT